MKQHRIGIDARMLGAEQTGIGKYIARLLEHVPPLMPEARFVVFLREPEFSRFQSPYANVEKRRASAHWYGYAEQVVFPLQLMRARVDLMHFPHFNVPLLYPGKFLVTIHDLTPLYFPGPKMGSWWKRAAFRTVFASAVRRAEKIISVSSYTKGDIVKNFHIAPEKIRVMPEGVDAPPSMPSPEQARDFLQKTYGITKPFILYVGVWREHKNLAGLIRAFAILLKKYRLDIDLVLCGKEQPSYPEPRAMWEQFGIGDRIQRPGFVPEKDLAYFYRAAELTVVPSFAEGFGFTGLESLAHETSVAASRLTSLPEVLGDAAIYFNPHNSEDMARVIHQALTCPENRDKLLTNAKSALARYRWDQMAFETVRQYRLLHEVLP